MVGDEDKKERLGSTEKEGGIGGVGENKYIRQHWGRRTNHALRGAAPG